MDNEYEFIKPLEEHIKELMLGLERELVSAIVQLHLYRCEYETNKHIGKQQALEGVATYEKRVRLLQENIQVYEQYCSDKAIAINL